MIDEIRYLIRTTPSSLYLLITSIGISVSGFLFWILASKHYEPSDVGYASSILSLISLMVIISRVGLDQSLIKYCKNNNSCRLVTSLVTTLLVISFISMILYFNIGWIASDLVFLKNSYIPIFLILILSSIKNIFGIYFLSNGNYKAYFIEYLFEDLRIVFLLPLSLFGVIGIISSLGLSTLLSVLISLYFLRFDNSIELCFNASFIKQSFKFSSITYFAGLFQIAPLQIIPLLILNELGSGEVARYYLNYTISSTILMIPTAFATAMFIDGSTNKYNFKQFKFNIIIYYLILITYTLFLLIFGGYILDFFGTYYSSDILLFNLLVIYNFIISNTYLYISIKKLQNNLIMLLLFNMISFILIFAFIYALVDSYELIGICISLILSAIISNLITIFDLYYNRSSFYSMFTHINN